MPDDVTYNDNLDESEFNIWVFMEKNKVPVFMFLLGALLIGFGLIVFKKVDLGGSDKIEVLESTSEAQGSEIVVEVAGAVERAGVYKLTVGSRVEDAIISAGGFSANADRQWVGKSLNRAAKLSDGQKIYIPSFGEILSSQNQQTQVKSAKNSGGNQSGSSIFGVSDGGLIDINTAPPEELDTLPGIGPVYGQKIIEQRPYSNVDELLTRKIIPSSTFEKIKNSIKVY